MFRSAFLSPFLSRLRWLILFALCLPFHALALDGEATLRGIVERGDALTAAYDPAYSLATATEFSALYFERFEALELDLGLRNAGLKTELEVLFGALNGNAMRGVPKPRLEASWSELRAKLEEARALYGEGSDSASESGIFLKSLFILLREGVEAMLVVGALAAYLRRAGAADKVWVIHAGVALAIPLSILTGWAVQRFLASLGAPLAVVEGFTMLAASAMLFYVSCWLFGKREAKRWEAWIAGQLESALGRGSLLALGGTACLAVYREGAETVLFYQALAATMDAGAAGQESALYAGGALGALLLVGFYFLLRHAALRLPFGLFFGGTSILLYGLSIVFIGQAIVELQAAGWIASIHLPGFPQIGWLGVAPSAQSLGAQALLLSLPLAWFVANRFSFIPKKKEAL
jgi:high-affinity iron transporter